MIVGKAGELHLSVLNFLMQQQYIFTSNSIKIFTMFTTLLVLCSMMYVFISVLIKYI